MEKVTDIEVAKKLMQIQASAESRGIPFNMSLKKVRQLLNTRKCFISGEPLNRVTGDPNQLTFDRLDNNDGYTDDNVVACSLKMNRIKASLTISEITMLYMAIQKKNVK